MDEQLIYCIATEYIVLHTPSAEVTATLLPSYEPFRVPSLPDGCEPLFQFSGGIDLDSKKRIALLEDKLSEGVRAQVYHTDDRQLLLELTINRRHHALCVDQDWRTISSDVLLDDPSAAIFINRLIMIAYGVAIAPYRMLKMHASVTVLNGEALLFLGVSGTGKSTHSRLWRKYVPGATLLNDDEPIVRVLEDGEVCVYGCPWSGSTPCYKNESARVKAFIYLYQAPENKLTRLRGRDSFDAIYSSSAFLHSDKVRHLAMFDTVADILELIPVYRLDCEPNEGAVALTRQLLEK